MKYTISGANTLQMINGEWYVNGEKMSLDEMIKRGIASEDGESGANKGTEITIIGDVGRIVNKFGKIVVEGSCNRVKTISGDVEIRGDVEGDVETTSGNISCGNVAGDVSTVSGRINHR